MRLKLKQPIWATIAMALAGGTLFKVLHIPLPWMLGPMTALLIWREVFGRRAVCPIKARDAGLVLLGYMMGGAFTAGVVVQIAGQLHLMAAATALTVGFAMVMGWFTARKTGISTASGILGSIPGGLTQMVALCTEIKNADITAVTFMQTIRLMTVIFVVPFLAVHGLAGGIGNGTSGGLSNMGAGTGYAVVRQVQGDEGALNRQLLAAADGEAEAGIRSNSVENVMFPDGGTAAKQAAALLAEASGDKPWPWLSLDALWFILAVGCLTWLAPRLRLPTPYFLGPLLAAAVLCVSGLDAPELPGLVIIFAQILVGAHLGVSSKLSSLSNWRRLLPFALLGGGGIVLFSMGVGYVLSRMSSISFVTAFLSASPGGMTEMGLAGAAVGADLSMIVAYQMFRILFILFIVPYIVKGLLRVRPGGADYSRKDSAC